MKKSLNQFRSLQQPGIRGQAVSRDYKSISIYNTQALSVQIRTGQLIPGVWDFGFAVTTSGPNGIAQTSSKVPGEGQGWFKSEEDAVLFALGHLRAMFEPGSDIVAAIDSKIAGLTNKSLF